jgi:hypothetical protein
MEIIEVDGVDRLALSYEEEQNLARSVMDCIAIRWVQGEFQNLLDRIYYWKCTQGYWAFVDDILLLLDYMDQYDLPQPRFVDDGKNIKDDLDQDVYTTREDRELEQRRMVIQAWREVWERHDAHKDMADRYLVFPGDEERETMDEDEAILTEQAEIEAAFWEEVDRVVISMSCSRMDAIRMVSDYMMRGDIG